MRLSNDQRQVGANNGSTVFDADARRRMRAEADRYLAKRSLSGVVVSGTITVVVFFLRDTTETESRVLLGLAMAMVLLCLVRIWWGVRFEVWHPRNPARWLRLFTAGAVVSGASWCAYGGYFISVHGITTSSLLVVVACTGLCAGAINTFAPSLFIQRMYLFLVLAPVAAMPFYAGAMETFGLTVMSILYAGFLWTQGGMMNEAYWQGLRDTVLLEHRAAELETARQNAENASIAKGSFLANMSHEIRTPMNGLMGMLDLALDGKIDPTRRECLEVARSSADSLLRILDDILDFSKIESGKMALENIPFSLRDDVLSAMRTLSIQASGKRIALTEEIEADVPDRLVGDPGRLRQVLFNLVGNAIKFTEEGEVVIGISRPAGEELPVRLEFEIRDTGIGISEEKLGEIFEAFTQADGSTTRRYGGTGLGLAISRSLIGLMGGELSVRSRPGSGSVFSFTAEFLPHPQQAGEVGDGLGRAVPGERTQARRLNILLAEDNSVNRMVALRMLEREGHSIRAVENGQEVLDALESGSFDLVLMDVQMPVLDGIRAVEEIRRREQDAGGHLPVLALTAHAMKGDRERFLRAGMDAYISKPINRDELVAGIETLMGRQADAGR